MARCYHDTQDFKSDLKIEVARECDILEAGEDIKNRKCTKNPGHEGFIPFSQLSLNHLPYERRNKEMLDNIKQAGSIVVRLVVHKIQNGEQITVAGSGCVIKLDNEYLIQTNNHVVKTEDDVKHCTVDFHYDDDKDRYGVLTSRGVRLVWTCPYRDFTLFTFHPVPDFLHQLDLFGNKLPSIVIMYKNNLSGTRVIYPYYKTSQLQFRSDLNLNSSLIELMFILSPDNSFSYIKSPYFKFEPIPANIQELTSIEIHKEEDEGNSRVIPGDVVKFGDEFVVNISESIFQDEVKKCRLVWNGEVIGRGTRLYFKQVKSSNIYSGVDLEHQLENGIENYWLFEFHPIPRYIEDMLNREPSGCLCCIGHPHGGIKMVTFGTLLGKSTERFDNQYRRITQLNSDCQCKEVGVVKYSCKTCEGSSGSLILSLDQSGDEFFGYCHFMGQSVTPHTIRDELVENMNSAWIHLPANK